MLDTIKIRFYILTVHARNGKMYGVLKNEVLSLVQSKVSYFGYTSEVYCSFALFIGKIDL